MDYRKHPSSLYSQQNQIFARKKLAIYCMGLCFIILLKYDRPNFILTFPSKIALEHCFLSVFLPFLLGFLGSLDIAALRHTTL